MCCVLVCLAGRLQMCKSSRNCVFVCVMREYPMTEGVLGMSLCKAAQQMNKDGDASTPTARPTYVLLQKHNR